MYLYADPKKAKVRSTDANTCVEMRGRDGKVVS